jgi:hypothetical protein
MRRRPFDLTAGNRGLAAFGALIATACAAHYEPMRVEPPSSPQAVVFLIGDGGEAGPARDSLLRHVDAQIAALRSGGGGPPVAVVFLGDNVYPEGVRPNQMAEDIENLVAQVSVGTAPGQAPLYFLPGNHDWADSGEAAEGVRRLRLQAAAIDSLAAGRVRTRFVPSPGCPGPETASLGDVATLVFIDTEWLLRDAQTCDGWDRTRFLEELRRTLRASPGIPKIVLAHHPLVTGGPHGGAWPGRGLWGNVLGPFRWLVYQLAVNGQDATSGRYSRMVDDLLGVFFEEGLMPLVYAAGHDHSLQVVGVERDGEELMTLVSGSVARPSNVRRIDGMRFATSNQGYMRLDLLGDSARITLFAFERSDVSGRSEIRTLFSCRIRDCQEARR